MTAAKHGWSSLARQQGLTVNESQIMPTRDETNRRRRNCYRHPTRRSARDSRGLRAHAGSDLRHKQTEPTIPEAAYRPIEWGSTAAVCREDRESERSDFPTSPSRNQTRIPSSRRRSASSPTTALSVELWLRNRSWVNDSRSLWRIRRSCWSSMTVKSTQKFWPLHVGTILEMRFSLGTLMVGKLSRPLRMC